MKLSEYLTEGIFDKRMSNMKTDLEKKYGKAKVSGTMKLTPVGGNKAKHDKAIDAIYNNLIKVPEFKRLSMDRQGEISMKVLALIMGRG